MSAAGVADLVAQRVRQDAGQAEQDSNLPRKPLSDELSAVAAYIPTEGLAAYVALYALADSDSIGYRWTFFAVGLILNAFFTFAHYPAKTAKRDVPVPSGHSKIAMAAVATSIAFTAYIMTLPGNPFSTIVPITVGAIAVVLLAPTLPYIARWLGFGPRPPVLTTRSRT